MQTHTALPADVYLCSGSGSSSCAMLRKTPEESLEKSDHFTSCLGAQEGLGKRLVVQGQAMVDIRLR